MSEADSAKNTLQAYFDDLLINRQQSSPLPQTPLLDDQSEHRVRVEKLLRSRTLEIVKRDSQIQTECLPKSEVDAPTVTQTVDRECDINEKQCLADPNPVPLLDWMENGRPEWAQEKFEVLLLKVQGLTLAVPLICLGHIQPINDQLTPIVGQSDWFMGVQLTPVGKLKTVNTAKFVMPERYDDRFLKTARYVISINELPWGLAVDSVKQPIALEPQDVQWRANRSQRSWLAGTVKAHMCVLLDIPCLGKTLLDAETDSPCSDRSEQAG